MSLLTRHSKTHRWGRVREIKHVRSILDGRHKTPTLSASFAALPLRLRHLASWRRTHMLPGGHLPVRRRARFLGKTPSSNMNLNQKAEYIAKREGKSIT